MSFEHHLHWQSTGKATWRLSSCRVRVDSGPHAGAGRLTVFHANVRLCVDGSIKWNVGSWSGIQERGYLTRYESPPRLPDSYWSWKKSSKLPEYTPVGHARIEEAFRAELAARALRGHAEGYLNGRIATPCDRCPDVLRARSAAVSMKASAARVWTSWVGAHEKLGAQATLLGLEAVGRRW